MEKIAAVIVTYNRLELLKECIKAINNQSLKPTSIIVVNNDSTDGTTEWLKTANELIVINQENLGGAGGFHNGMKHAINNGYDWVWLMDDDGYPEENALKNLYAEYLKDSTKKILNSIVVVNQDPNKFSFVTRIYNNDESKKLENLSSFENIIELKKKYPNCNVLSTLGGFFNSSLINSEVISQSGLPIKELYIRGDEFEYSLRVTKNGFRKYLVLNSVHYHPIGDSGSISIMGKIIPLEVKSEFKLYYHVRNLTYINKMYHLGLGNIFLRNLAKEFLILLLGKRRIAEFPNILIILIKSSIDSKNLNLYFDETNK